MSPENSVVSTGASASFSWQIGVLFATILALALLGSTIGYWSLNRLSTETTNMVDEVMSTERIAAELQRHILINVARNKALALSSEPQVGDALQPEIGETSQQVDRLLKHLATVLTAKDDVRTLQQMTQANQRFLAALQKLAVARDRGLTANIENVYKDDFTPAAGELQAAVTRLGQAQRERIGASAKHIAQLSQAARWSLVAFSLFALIMGTVMSVWLVRNITRPIQQAVDTANRVASLDLTANIDGHERNEAGRLLNALSRMQASLHTLVDQVQDTSHNVAEGATQIAAGQLDCSKRTELINAFLQQTATSIDEVADAMRVSLQAVDRNQTLVKVASLEASSGSAVMTEVMQAMADINDSSRQIVDIIAVIDGIAFQTNILALNAAVEAARAGAQGRGFAVVASEVRTLANRSAQAAGEIKTLIGTSADKIKLGTHKANNARETMGKLFASVERMATGMGEIHAGSRIQTNSIANINSAVSQLEQMSQQNAAAMQEAAASARSLQDQAGDLRDATNRFKLPPRGFSLLPTAS